MGENFGEFGELLQIRQSLTLIVPEISVFIALEFAKVYFAKCNLAYYLPKFPSIWYTGTCFSGY